MSEPLVERLRERSASRVEGREEFSKLADDVARYKRRKDEQTISLVEAEFQRQWNEGKAADDEEKKLQELDASQKRPVVRRDYWFDEAMNVTIDYLQSLTRPEALADVPRSAKVVPPTPAVPAIP